MVTTPLESETFRQLMRRVPASVSVIATGSPGRRNGLTATSICALSVAPPMLIACVSHRASAHDAITDNGFFTVNVLSAGDQRVATIFSADSGARGEARFIDDGWTEGSTGAPVWKSALCYLECRLADSARGSTHTIFFGDVVAGSALPGATPLLYMNGAFRTLSSHGSPGNPSDRSSPSGRSETHEGNRIPRAKLSAVSID